MEDFSIFELLERLMNNDGYINYATFRAMIETKRQYVRIVERDGGGGLYMVCDRRKCVVVIDSRTGKVLVNFGDTIVCYDEEINYYVGEGKEYEVHKCRLDTERVCLFYWEGEWYVVYQSNLVKLGEQCDGVGKIEAKVMCELVENSCIKLEKLDVRLSYYLLIRHSSLRKLGIGFECDRASVTRLWVGGGEVGKGKGDEDIEEEKVIKFSCIDEMMTALDVLNCDDMKLKRITYGGYLVKVYDRNSRRYSVVMLYTALMKFVLGNLPGYDNQYRNYVKMYQLNVLHDVLPYIHKYSMDVIKRINMSFRTFAKEFVSLYHLTRKKQNVVLYEKLTQCYRKVLCDLHRIYVGGRGLERGDEDDIDVYDKKSITVEIVYNYLKKMKTNELIQLFFDRKILIEQTDIVNYGDFLYVDNIDVAAHTELMLV